MTTRDRIIEAAEDVFDRRGFAGTGIDQITDAAGVSSRTLHKHLSSKTGLIAFVFPVSWWAMPALMKGWIERVFTGGWAHQYGTGVADRGTQPLRGLLPSVPTALIGAGGSTRRTYDRYGRTVNRDHLVARGVLDAGA